MVPTQQPVMLYTSDTFSVPKNIILEPLIINFIRYIKQANMKPSDNILLLSYIALCECEATKLYMDLTGKGCQFVYIS
jgi:hypothetical protein